jgi:hypothetical protein
MPFPATTTRCIEGGVVVVMHIVHRTGASEPLRDDFEEVARVHECSGAPVRGL